MNRSIVGRNRFAVGCRLPDGPAESVTARKEARLVAAATAYVQALPQLPAGQRIDVVAVQLSPGGRLLAIDHIQGAVAE